MSQVLISRIRKNRELRVEAVAPFIFIAKRPTEAEATELFGALSKESAEADAAARGRALVKFYRRTAEQFVIGWEKVTENDVVGGGGTDLIAFDATLWAEWCADRRDFWEPLAGAIVEAYRLYAERLEGASKN